MGDGDGAWKIVGVVNGGGKVNFSFPPFVDDGG